MIKEVTLLGFRQAMPVDGSNGKREVADKKKKKSERTRRGKEKGREKCTLGNNNNRGRRHGQKYGAAGAARHTGQLGKGLVASCLNQR